MQTKSQPVNFTPGSASALVATAIIDEAIEFMEGFRDDTTQELDINARLDNLIGLRNALKGGAAFTAHQAEEAELARYNAGPVVHHPIDLPCGVVAFEPATQGGAA